MNRQAPSHRTTKLCSVLLVALSIMILSSSSKFVVVGAASFCVFLLFSEVDYLSRTLLSLDGYSASSSSTYSQSTLSRERKLGDGCYHVFLDVGSNIGMHARFLFEPEKYPLSTSSVDAFNREFGVPRDNRDYCVFAFEPNPKFERRHIDLQKAYAAIGWRYVPILAGASDADGEIVFYHSAFEKEEWETGFSAVTPKTLYGREATPRTVPIVRLASWIQNEIQDRKIPVDPHVISYPESGDAGPKVIMKLDIEGLEFRVFPDLLTSGALCNNINFMMGEFHYYPGNHNYYPINLTSDGQHVLQDRKQGERLSQQLLRLPEISENCKTRIVLADDESYLKDPYELPSPNGTVSATN